MARDLIAVMRDVAADSFILAVSDELPAMLSVAANDDRSVGSVSDGSKIALVQRFLAAVSLKVGHAPVLPHRVEDLFGRGIPLGARGAGCL